MRDTDYRQEGRFSGPLYEAAPSYIGEDIPFSVPRLEDDLADMQPGDLELIDRFADLGAADRRAVLKKAKNMLEAVLPPRLNDQ